MNGLAGTLTDRPGDACVMKHLPPAYFALVMAIGIVSIAAGDFHLPILATVLLVLNLVAYAVLAGLTVLRAVR